MSVRYLKHGLISLLLSIAQLAFAQPLSSQVSTKQEKPFKLKYFNKLNASLEYNFGGATNVAKLENEQDGRFHQLSPSINFDVLSSDTSFLNFELLADLKNYTESVSRKLGDESQVSARLLGTQFVSDRWEWGGEGGYLFLDGNQPIQLSTVETISQDQKYAEYDGRLYLAWYGDELSLEAGAKLSTRDYETKTLDRGNEFFNNYQRESVDFKVGRIFNDDLNIQLVSELKRTTYEDRPADFSDGAPSVTTSPLPTLREEVYSFDLKTEYNLLGIKLTTTPSYIKNNDRIFGALDADSFKIAQKAEFNFTEKWAWTPEISFLEQRFARYKSSPVDDPLGSPLRVDQVFSVKSNLKYTFNKNAEGQIGYSMEDVDSNYGGSSYKNTVVTTGLTFKL